MHIAKIEIKNFRALKDVTIYPTSLLTLVGKNNSGKSTVLKALELFFENSMKLVSEESFYNKNTSLQISIEVWFSDLQEWKKEELKPWINEGLLKVKRVIKMDDSGNPTTGTFAIVKEPSIPWLRDEEITTANIAIWKNELEHLEVAGKYFKDYLSQGKTTIDSWKNAAHEFIEKNMGSINFEDKEMDNPKGYPNVLKGTLPEFIIIPAVRSANDEAKVTTTSAFGKLINKLLLNLSPVELEDLERNMQGIGLKLNRSSGSNRLSKIEMLETKLNRYLAEIINCDMELEFTIPSIKDVFGQVKVFLKDGFRTGIESKGHGLQRSVIFTILRTYAEIKNEISESAEKKQRSTIFAIEEPEIYLHPLLQRTLYHTLRNISSNGDQVFYCTHSSLFVEVQYFDEICVLKKVATPECDEVKVVQLPVQTLIEDLKLRKGIPATADSIRELYSNVFDSMVTEGFFADKVVLVEGPSEKYILPIYALLIDIDLDKENIAVIISGGKGNMDRLLRIFSGFEIPTYIWFDGDKNTTDAETRKKTLELLEILGDPKSNISEISTTIKSNYAVLEVNLEATLEKEIKDYKKKRNEAEKYMGKTGKPLIHKYMAKVISQETTKEHSDPNSNAPATILAIVEQIHKLDIPAKILKTK